MNKKEILEIILDHFEFVERELPSIRSIVKEKDPYALARKMFALNWKDHGEKVHLISEKLTKFGSEFQRLSLDIYHHIRGPLVTFGVIVEDIRLKRDFIDAIKYVDQGRVSEEGWKLMDYSLIHLAHDLEELKKRVQMLLSQ